MHIFGLTGGIASGKSFVRATLENLGAHVLDADAIYHSLIAPLPNGEASPLALAIAAAFPNVMKPDGTLDRAKLGEQVFSDAQALARLGQITHPAVAQETGRRMQALAEKGVARVVYDVPLLYERGLETGMHGVMVVWVPRQLQLERLMQRDGLLREQAEKRVQSQMSLDEKRTRATWVVDNSGSREATQSQVREVWESWEQAKD